MYDNLLPYAIILIWSGIDAKQIIVWWKMYALVLHHEIFVFFCSFDVSRLCIRNRTRIVVNDCIKLSRIQYIMAVYIFKNFIMLSVLFWCNQMYRNMYLYSFLYLCIFLYLLYLFISFVSFYSLCILYRIRTTISSFINFAFN